MNPQQSQNGPKLRESPLNSVLNAGIGKALIMRYVFYSVVAAAAGCIASILLVTLRETACRPSSFIELKVVDNEAPSGVRVYIEVSTKITRTHTFIVHSAESHLVLGKMECKTKSGTVIFAEVSLPNLTGMRCLELFGATASVPFGVGEDGAITLSGSAAEERLVVTRINGMVK